MAETKTEGRTATKADAVPEGRVLAQTTTDTGVVITVAEAASTEEADPKMVKILEDQNNRDRMELMVGERGRDRSEFVPRGEGYPPVETPVLGMTNVVYEGKDPKTDKDDNTTEEGYKVDKDSVGPGDKSTYNR